MFPQSVVNNNWDARGSHFTEVGGNVTVHYNFLTIRFELSIIMVYKCDTDLADDPQRRKHDDSVSLRDLKLAALTDRTCSILVAFLH